MTGRARLDPNPGKDIQELTEDMSEEEQAEVRRLLESEQEDSDG